MGTVSAQVEALFVPKKGHDKAHPDGIWDLATSAALERRIDKRVCDFLKVKSSSRSFRTVAKLRCIVGTGNYTALLDALTEAAKYFTAGSLSVADHTLALSARAPKRGRPRKPEVQLLLYDVQVALNAALGETVKIWQSANPEQQSCALVISRMVAASVGKPLPCRIRTIINKTQSVERL